MLCGQHTTPPSAPVKHTCEERAKHGNLPTFLVRQRSLFVFLLQDGPRLLRNKRTGRINRGEVLWWLFDMPMIKIKEVA